MRELREYCKKLSIDLTDRQLEQFQLYYDLLIEWNEKVNLTAITEYDEVLKKHFLDSLALVKGREVDLINKVCSGMSSVLNTEKDGNTDCDKSFEINKKEDCIRLLDIGTGAGFPAIPLKIVYPQLSVVMLDSLNKRINFLNEVILRLNLSNISALHGRAEDYAKKPDSNFNHQKNSLPTKNVKNIESEMPICCREGFDIVVSRAVANLSTLSEYCLPYVRVGGIFVAYKSEELAREQKEAEHAVCILGGRVEKVFDFILPCTDYHRNLCIIRKVKPTPNKYPRKAGTPAKEPLK